MEMETCTINCALLDFHTWTVHSNIQDEIFFRKLHQVHLCVYRKPVKSIKVCIGLQNVFCKLKSVLTILFVDKTISWQDITHVHCYVIYPSCVILKYKDLSENGWRMNVH